MKKLFYVVFAWLVAVQCAYAAVNINTATLDELEQLPGVGPAKAQAILDDRTQNGKYKNIEELKRVKGIGDSTFDKLKKEITVTGATTGVSEAGKKTAAKADKDSKATSATKADKTNKTADKKPQKNAAKQGSKAAGA